MTRCPSNVQVKHNLCLDIGVVVMKEEGKSSRDYVPVQISH